MIDLRDKEGWVYKYEELLDCNHPHFIGAKMHEGVPCFTFTIDVQELDYKINKVDGTPYVWTPPIPKEGDEPQGEEHE